MTNKVTLEYTTVNGKNIILVLESRAKALETLKKLKKYGIVKTYAKGYKTRSLILTADYCPICKKIMRIGNPNEVWLLTPVGKQLTAHRTCCNKEKVPYMDNSQRVYPK